MALDRFVRWEDKSKLPTPEKIREILEDYLGVSSWVKPSLESSDAGNWFFVKLPGPSSFPFKRQKDALPDRGFHDDRWFEVCCIHDDCIDVITRQADEFTNDVAYGFAKLIARWFDGTLDE